MTNAEALYQVIIENPDDDTARMIYADTLDELGDDESVERAEFIRLGVKVARQCFVCLGTQFHWFVGQSPEDSFFAPCPSCNPDNIACVSQPHADAMALIATKAANEYNVMRARLHEIEKAHPDWRTRKCEACGGDGYYKGARLGDEQCPTCRGEGDLLLRHVTVLAHVNVENETTETRIEVQSREPQFARGFIDRVNCWQHEFERRVSVTCEACDGGGEIVTPLGDPNTCRDCYGTRRTILFPEDNWVSVLLQKYPLCTLRSMSYKPRKTLSGGGTWLNSDDDVDAERAGMFADALDRSPVLPDWLFDRVGRYHASPLAATERLEAVLCHLVRQSNAFHKREREKTAARETKQ